MAREDLHFRLRIPEDLKNEIERASVAHRRSMTAEIVSRLEASFNHWPNVDLPRYLRERALDATHEQRESFLEELNKSASELAKRHFSDDDFQMVELVNAFNRLTRDLPLRERSEAKNDLNSILSNVLKALPKDQASKAYDNMYEAFNWNEKFEEE